jgi:3-mercaptopyruvate sulfurtransferase SseA
MQHRRRKTGTLWLALVIALVALSACQGNVPRTLDQVPRMAPSVVKERLDTGDDILVVDARSTTQYQQSHIPGAISVPLDQVASRLDELPQDQDIVFY